MTYSCIVCREGFNDLYEHLAVKKENKEHLGYGEKINKESFDDMGIYTIRCFCGGVIHCYGTSPGGWETRCTVCEYIYDED